LEKHNYVYYLICSISKSIDTNIILCVTTYYFDTIVTETVWDLCFDFYAFVNHLYCLFYILYLIKKIKEKLLANFSKPFRNQRRSSISMIILFKYSILDNTGQSTLTTTKHIKTQFITFFLLPRLIYKCLMFDFS